MILYMEDGELPFLGWNSYLLLDILNGRWSASFFGEKSMLEPMSLESKARWRKEIQLLLSEKKIFFSRTCVILIMLISSQIIIIFFFHVLIDNGNSTKKWYSCSVWSKCWLLYCLLLFLLWKRDYSLLFEISLSPKYFSFGFIFHQVI